MKYYFFGVNDIDDINGNRYYGVFKSKDEGQAKKMLKEIMEDFSEDAENTEFKEIPLEIFEVLKQYIGDFTKINSLLLEE